MSDNTLLTTKTQDLPEAHTATQIVSEGRERAKQLMDLVMQNKWSKNIQGKDYLQVEAWQTLGRFYGYTAITRETKYIEYNGIKGFDARVEILDKDGKVVGGAEASCMMDEQNWRGKPLFSVKSMAQTRALGKAYRQILSFVAVMGGFAPTPLEEMDGVIIDDRTEKVPAFGREAQIARNTPDEPASQAQLSLMGRLKSKMTAEEFENYGFLSKREASTLIDTLIKRQQPVKEVSDLDQEIHNEKATEEEESKWEAMGREANRRSLS